MNALQAHGLFALAASEGRVDRWPVELRLLPTGPLEMTALAIVSGWLDDCDTEAELLEASEQGLMLADINVKHVEDFDAAINEVMGALHDAASVMCN